SRTSLAICSVLTGFVHFFVLFFFNDTATPEIYTLSLHDALPISSRSRRCAPRRLAGPSVPTRRGLCCRSRRRRTACDRVPRARRSEEHTSELQSRFDLVCRLLLEKKKKS